MNWTILTLFMNIISFGFAGCSLWLMESHRSELIPLEKGLWVLITVVGWLVIRVSMVYWHRLAFPRKWEGEVDHKRVTVTRRKKK